MHQLEKMRRAQIQQVDEMSVQKLRENHETFQQLTSHLQQMQGQMNSMNDSGDFQEVESNHCGRLSHVSSQPEMIPSSRPLLSRKKRLPLDTWNQSGVQENVFGNQFSTFDSPRVDYKFYNTGGITAELCGRTAKTANIGVAIRQIPYYTNLFYVGR